jgi:predicted RNA polymerase sigma factor
VSGVLPEHIRSTGLRRSRYAYCQACVVTCWPSSGAAEARAEFERAAELTSNEAERSHLLARAGTQSRCG